MFEGDVTKKIWSDGSHTTFYQNDHYFVVFWNRHINAFQPVINENGSFIESTRSDLTMITDKPRRGDKR